MLVPRVTLCRLSGEAATVDPPGGDADNWATSMLRMQAALLFGQPLCAVHLVGSQRNRISNDDSVTDEFLGVVFTRPVRGADAQ